MKPDTQILLVEDEAPVRDVWRRYLQRWAYTHEIVPNAEEALALARRRRFDLVITDLAMPGMSGQALLTTLKAEQPELAVIVVTGFGTVQVAVEIMKAGAYDFITKPINFVHAELVVKNCLEQLRVQRESVRLQKVAADLQALNELKEKFIAITNHELRTPVGIIRSVAELLRAEDDGGELGMLVDILARASGQLTEIVSQMHEISSVKSDKLQLRRTTFNLGELCEEVFAENRLVLQRRELAVQRRVADELSVFADRARFKKVLRELIQNAIKFTPDGGTITLEAYCEGPDELRLRVSDTGVGIAPEYQTRIFELFYEVRDASHHHSSADDFLGGGMGIGLSMVSDIVAAHDGTVRVDSALGQGACFTVMLPHQSSCAA